MKLSNYNFLKNYDGVNVFFNAKTCALAIVNDEFLQVYTDIENGLFDENKYSQALLSDMKLSGCILEDDINELHTFEYYRNMQKYDNTNLGLTIAPTLDCNFRCTYCFENHQKGLMSESVQKALIQFIKSKIGVIKTLSITWYGGEPLLAKKIIYSLSEAMVALCEANKVKYNAFIITNASLLTDEDIVCFKKYRITGAQVTIDGPKEIHDSRRINISGNSTFDLLLKNVNKLLAAGLDVVVRINIDKNNIDHVNDLLITLKSEIALYQKIKIDFGKVSAFTDVCKDIENNCYDNEQYANILLPLYGKVLSMGFSMNKMVIYPKVRFNYCCAEYANSFVIDSEGYLYKCWNHVGRTNTSCGNLQEAENQGINNNYLKWILRNPVEDKKCKECKYLPICVGGCPDIVFEKKDNSPACDIIKYNLDEVLRFYYLTLKGSEEN